MSFDLTLITENALVIVPLCVALVQAIKMTGFIKDAYAPLLAIAVGIVIAFIGNHATNDYSFIVLSGCVYGLMASGLYSGVKTSIVAVQQAKRERAKQNN